MFRSENINELATALAKAQAEFPPIPKNKTVDFTHNGKRTFYKYADLSDVISMTAPILSKYGLSITQPVGLKSDKMILETILFHSSGQFLSSDYPIMTFDKPQEQGSEITYARRYSLTAILGIQADEDEDGQLGNEAAEKNKINGTKNSRVDPQQRGTLSPIQPKSNPKSVNAEFDPQSMGAQKASSSGNGSVINLHVSEKKTLGFAINEERRRLGWTAIDLGEFMTKNFGKHGSELSIEEMGLLIDTLKKQKSRGVANE